ncbi:MAG: hypothetical protein GY795_39520 [Desulfobacterales bacterium]|nr:hypothetical protein [Desulfobacterales bacterium]
MKSRNYKIIFWNLIVGLACILAVVFSFRILALITLIALFVLLRWHLKYNFHRVILTVGTVFVLASLQPFDISVINVPGSPKIVPYIKGLPSKKTREKAERGEVVLGGCIVTGNHPKWLLVW